MIIEVSIRRQYMLSVSKMTLQVSPRESPLDKIWRLVVQAGYYVQSQKRDGRKGWADIRDAIETGAKELHLKYIFRVKYSFMLLVLNHYRPGCNGATCQLVYLDNILNSSSEVEYFPIQLFRLCYRARFRLDLITLAQIGYHVGQTLATIKHNPVAYPKLFLEFFVGNRLDHWQTYISI